MLVTNSLTHWLTNSCLVNLIDVTLACEDGNSKLVVTVWLCLSVTDSLTHYRLVNLIDMTLACEDGNSKLIEVVTVADVDDEKRFDASFMQIWKVKFGHKAKFCSDFEHKVWPRVWSWSSSETFETEVWSVFCCWGLVRLWSECLVKILMLKFGRKILNFGIWSRFV